MNHNRILINFKLILYIGLLVSILMPLHFLFAADSVTLISHWKLDEAAQPFVDSTNSNNASCISEDSCPEQVTGKWNKAQLFERSTQKGLNVSGDLYNWGNNDSFSIAFWMKRLGPPPEAGISNNEVIIGRDDRPVQYEGLHWWVGVHNEDGKARFTLIDSNSNGIETSLYLLGTTELTDGKWHHIAAVRDAENNKNLLYVDGALEDSREISYPADFASSAANLCIGYMQETSTGNRYFYSGVVDDIRIYNGALSPSSINRLVNSNPNTPMLPLLLDD